MDRKDKVNYEEKHAIDLIEFKTKVNCEAIVKRLVTKVYNLAYETAKDIYRNESRETIDYLKKQIEDLKKGVKDEQWKAEEVYRKGQTVE